ncbi:MAG: hypothetical protein SFV54_26265 [Bryobacteraceae bacterium]|nr:hypothetical protein [Bryobacteraceae bacterium]
MPRLHINLASEPFRRDRPILVASGVVAVIMVASLVFLISLSVFESQEVAETRATIASLQKQLTAVGQEQAKIDSTLRQAHNAEVLDRNLFLNMLIDRKSISWTKIFSDLESVVPHDVRLIQVRLSPQASTLDMVVAAQSSQPVIEFLLRVEKSPLFGPTTVQAMLPPSQSEPLYRYRVSVKYEQKI